MSGRISCNDGAFLLSSAVAGHGLVYLHEPALLEHVERGELKLSSTTTQ